MRVCECARERTGRRADQQCCQFSDYVIKSSVFWNGKLYSSWLDFVALVCIVNTFLNWSNKAEGVVTKEKGDWNQIRMNQNEKGDSWINWIINAEGPNLPTTKCDTLFTPRAYHPQRVWWVMVVLLHNQLSSYEQSNSRQHRWPRTRIGFGQSTVRRPPRKF